MDSSSMRRLVLFQPGQFLKRDSVRAGNTNDFTFRARSRNYRNRILWQFETFCQQSNQFPIGGTLYGRRGNTNSQDAIILTGYLAARCPRNDAYREGEAAIVFGILNHSRQY